MFYNQIVRASSYGVPVTIHAGEWPTEGGLNTIENVHFAWRELNVRRIGHGIALRADEDFEKTILEMKSHLGNEGELKPITIEVMRFSKFFCDSNYRISPSCDNTDQLSQVTLNGFRFA